MVQRLFYELLPAPHELSLFFVTLIKIYHWLVCCFRNKIAVLHPPKPDAVFRNIFNSFEELVVITLIGFETPFSSKPRDLYKVFSFRECIPTIVSNKPEAPKVCPK